MEYRCSVCREMKNREDFPVDLSKKLRGGISYTCRKCKTEAARAYQKEYQREYRKTHRTHGVRDEVRAKARALRKAERALLPAKSTVKKVQVPKPEYHKAYHLKRAYGLSREELDERLREQEGKCAICRVTLTLGGRTQESMVVDHCHGTGEVRGLLCRACNVGLGFFKDSIGTLANAVRYLRSCN